VTAIKAIQLALLLMKFVNWITQRVSQKEWEASGYRKAMADSLAEMQVRVKSAEAELTKAKGKSDEELRKELEE
jgi:hypothetical protein